ncbi:hypothetical protein B1742_10870 [Enterobacter kobei]|nr:hypothetical protein B1742_10870 [Enterobacter kobei]
MTLATIFTHSEIKMVRCYFKLTARGNLAGFYVQTGKYNLFHPIVIELHMETMAVSGVTMVIIFI